MIINTSTPSCAIKSIAQIVQQQNQTRNVLMCSVTEYITHNFSDLLIKDNPYIQHTTPTKYQTAEYQGPHHEYNKQGNQVWYENFTSVINNMRELNLCMPFRPYLNDSNRYINEYRVFPQIAPNNNSSVQSSLNVTRYAARSFAPISFDTHCMEDEFSIVDIVESRQYGIMYRKISDMCIETILAKCPLVDCTFKSRSIFERLLDCTLRHINDKAFIYTPCNVMYVSHTTLHDIIQESAHHHMLENMPYKIIIHSLIPDGICIIGCEENIEMPTQPFHVTGISQRYDSGGPYNTKNTTSYKLALFHNHDEDMPYYGVYKISD